MKEAANTFGFWLGLFFSEERGDMFLRNVG
jgi:hypothetical protein